MGFIVFSPLGKKNLRIARTTNRLVDQLWQELVLLRYLKGKEKVNASKSISPWIDQAKTYFLDASRSDWRSAGLLYYYSFLNLAKALLVVKKSFTYKSLNTISIYHGLRADLQNVANLTDFKFEICPAQQRGRNNIFPYLYKVMTNRDWPFTNAIVVQVADIGAYCEDIGVEFSRLFNIEPKVLSLQSLLRIENNQSWFEMAVPTAQMDTIKAHFPDWNLESIDSAQISEADKTDWLLSLHHPANFFGNIGLLRSPKQTSDNLNKTVKTVAKEATSYLEDYVLPNFHEKPETATWDFCPNITLNSVEIKWHPMLSDYLMAFVLSTILRYQPQLLHIGTPNCFVAEGWCSQSAPTVLRYFLTMFTNPPLHIETH
jgi:hypothetical protein